MSEDQLDHEALEREASPAIDAHSSHAMLIAEISDLRVKLEAERNLVRKLQIYSAKLFKCADWYGAVDKVDSREAEILGVTIQ